MKNRRKEIGVSAEYDKNTNSPQSLPLKERPTKGIPPKTLMPDGLHNSSSSSSSVDTCDSGFASYLGSATFDINLTSLERAKQSAWPC